MTKRARASITLLPVTKMWNYYTKMCVQYKQLRNELNCESWIKIRKPFLLVNYFRYYVCGMQRS